MMHPQPGHHRRRPRRSRVLQVALLLAALAVGSAEHAKGSRRTPLGFLSAFQHQRGASSGPSVPLPVSGGGAGPDAQQPAVRPAPGHHAWFHHPQNKDITKPALPSLAGITPPAAAPHAPAPLAAAASSSSAAETQPGPNSKQDQAHQGFNGRFAFVNMQSLWQSLKSWRSFKHYLRGLRDLVLIAKPVEHFLLRTGTIHDRDLSRFIGKAVSFMLYSVLVTSVLGTFGIDTKPLITGIGISGFVVGFALKEVATNTLSGILLVVQRPFKTGWKIKVGSHSGAVLSIDSRYVRLQTENGEQILLPSYQVYSQAIVVQEKTDKYGRPMPAAGKLDPSAASAAGATAAGATSSTPPPKRSGRWD